VLSALAQADGDIRVTEIATALSLDKSVVHRILATLVDMDYATHDASTRRYRIGVRAWELGRKFTSRIALEQGLVPNLQAVVDDVGGTGYIGYLDGSEIVYLAVVHGSGAFRVHVDIGERVPAHTVAFGKAALAALPDGELERILAGQRLERRTKNTITSVAALRAELARIREQGFAINRGEARPGVGAVGVAILDLSGRPVAGASVAFPMLEQMDSSTWDLVALRLVDFVHTASRHVALLDHVPRGDDPVGLRRSETTA
jgi:DNA-binding IclR family transcriptional regulator